MTALSYTQTIKLLEETIHKLHTLDLAAHLCTRATTSLAVAAKWGGSCYSRLWGSTWSVATTCATANLRVYHPRRLRHLRVHGLLGCLRLYYPQVLGSKAQALMFAYILMVNNDDIHHESTFVIRPALDGAHEPIEVSLRQTYKFD